MRSTDASTPGSLCSPTRYAFLTGRYAWRGRLKYGVLQPPEGPILIEEELLTLPLPSAARVCHRSCGQMAPGLLTLRAAELRGMRSRNSNMENVEDLSALPLVPGPRSLGFDYHFAVPNHIDWLPKVYIENESIWGLRSKGKNPDKPFFSYYAAVAYFPPHLAK